MMGAALLTAASSSRMVLKRHSASLPVTVGSTATWTWMPRCTISCKQLRTFDAFQAYNPVLR